MKKIIILTISALALLNACKNDIELDMSQSHPVLTMNGFINADSLSHELLVTLTDPKEPVRISGATVEVWVNGNLTATAQEGEYAGWYAFDATLHAGDLVRINVTTRDGKHHAWIEETVPAPIDDISSVQVDMVKDKQYVSNNGWQGTDDLLRYRISFSDNGHTRDYYRLTTATHTTQRMMRYTFHDHSYETVYNYFPGKERSDYIGTEDPILMNGSIMTPSSDFDLPGMGNIANRYGVFNDLVFNGKDCSLTIYEPCGRYGREMEEYNEDRYYYSLDLQVTISNITAAEYYYLRAMNTRESDVYDDFSDLSGPIKMPSNVHGGTGMVGLRTSQTKFVHLQGSDYYPGISPE